MPGLMLPNEVFSNVLDHCPVLDLTSNEDSKENIFPVFKKRRREAESVILTGSENEENVPKKRKMTLMSPFKENNNEPASKKRRVNVESICLSSDSENENEFFVRRKKTRLSSFIQNTEMFNAIPKCSNCGLKTLEQCLKCCIYFCSKKCMLLGFQFHLEDCISIAHHSADPMRISQSLFDSKNISLRDFDLTPIRPLTKNTNLDQSSRWCSKIELTRTGVDSLQQQELISSPNDVNRMVTSCVSDTSHLSNSIDFSHHGTRKYFPNMETGQDLNGDRVITAVASRQQLTSTNIEIESQTACTNDSCIPPPTVYEKEGDNLICCTGEVKTEIIEEDCNFVNVQNDYENISSNETVIVGENNLFNSAKLMHGDSCTDDDQSTSRNFNPSPTNENLMNNENCHSSDDKRIKCTSHNEDGSKSDIVLGVVDDSGRSHHGQTDSSQGSNEETSSSDVPLNTSCEPERNDNVIRLPTTEKHVFEDEPAKCKPTRGRRSARLVSVKTASFQRVEDKDANKLITGQEELGNSRENIGKNAHGMQLKVSLDRLPIPEIYVKLHNLCSFKVVEKQHPAKKFLNDTTPILVESSWTNSEMCPTELVQPLLRAKSKGKMKTINAKEESEQGWWEENEETNCNRKWLFLEHRGPLFTPPYERLPKFVKFFYDGTEMRLSDDTEEAATFYARSIETKFTTKEVFNRNFFKDWRKVMSSEERNIITDLSKCNFRPMYEYLKKLKIRGKELEKEEEGEQEETKIHGVCNIDGRLEKVNNFRVPPPGLFRSRSNHPKMGMLRKRVMPEDVVINCSRDSKVPDPPPGHKWKDVKHDDTVFWLANWIDNVLDEVKYISLGPSSKIRAQKDCQKYEIARKLGYNIDRIRSMYTKDWESDDMQERQRGVALYLIDRFALTAGKKKLDKGFETFGCCTLRVGHVQLFEEIDGRSNVVVLNFPTKYSNPYYNEICVERQVFENLKIFCKGKSVRDDVFDKIYTRAMNKYLNEFIEGLTLSMFKIYNVSRTLQSELNSVDPNDSVPEKILHYNQICRNIAIHYNCQRAVEEEGGKSCIKILERDIIAKEKKIYEAKKEIELLNTSVNKYSEQYEICLTMKQEEVIKLGNELAKLLQAIKRAEKNAADLLKEYAFDPRISVAWCKKHGVPIEKIFTRYKKEVSKFEWAIKTTDADFVF